MGEFLEDNIGERLGKSWRLTPRSKLNSKLRVGERSNSSKLKLTITQKRALESIAKNLSDRRTDIQELHKQMYGTTFRLMVSKKKEQDLI